MKKMKSKSLWSFLTLSLISICSFIMVSCGGGDDSSDIDIDTTPITLYVGSKSKVNKANSLKSENEFVALVDNQEKSIKGYHVGTTFVKVNEKYRIPVTVKGSYNTYDDLITEWGCSQANIKSKQKQGTLSSKSSSDNLLYEKVGKADIIGYSFENGKLASIIAFVSTTYLNNYTNYIAERYFMLPYEKDAKTYFIGGDALTLDDSKTIVVLEVYNTKYLSCVYMPASKYKSSSKSNINNYVNNFKAEFE